MINQLNRERKRAIVMEECLVSHVGMKEYKEKNWWIEMFCAFNFQLFVT